MTCRDLLRLLAPATALLALALALALPAPAAAAGTYDVWVPNTDGYTGWWSPWAGTSQYRAFDKKVDTGAGTYVIGSYRRMRLDAPTDLRFAAAWMSGLMYTPNDAFVVHARQGDKGGAWRGVYANRENGSFNAEFTAADWIDIGLEAEKSSTTVDQGGNAVMITGLTVRMADEFDPEVHEIQLPDPVAWYGSPCLPLVWHETDRGSGVTRSELANVTTGAGLGVWHEQPERRLNPGPADITRQTCVWGSSQAHGTNVMRITSYDWAGRVRTHDFRVRFDLRAPTLGGLPADDTTGSDTRPAFTLGAADADSGLADVSARVDGEVAAVARQGDAWVARAERTLGVGRHELQVAARDQVGNVQTEVRSFRIVDVTPPTLTWSAPGASGGPSPVLQVAASDASGVDPTTWEVTANGEHVNATRTATRVTADLGPLATGVHAIEVRVSDVYGNVATIARSYEVTSPARAVVTASGRSGIFLGQAPEGVVLWGTQVHVSAVAAQHGRPLTGARVVVLQAGLEIASGVTDAAGGVDLRATILRPGQLEVVVPGVELTGAVVPIEVAPAITVRTSTRTSRVGRPVVVTGVVQPGAIGGKVELEARVGEAWYPLRRSVRVRRGGKFTATVRAATRGSFAIRVHMPARGGWAAGTSNVRRLNVRR